MLILKSTASWKTIEIAIEWIGLSLCEIRMSVAIATRMCDFIFSVGQRSHVDNFCAIFFHHHQHLAIDCDNLSRFYSKYVGKWRAGAKKNI